MREREGRRFNSYSRYLMARHGLRTFRVSVDAGFSCPNRAAGRNSPGCIYCDVDGSRAPYLGCETDLQRQVRSTISFLERRYRAEAFALYFQAFSGTNAPTEELRRIYDFGLSLHDFVELIVATRPDCIDAERADLLASYHGAVVDVWVELGLQSVNEGTLASIKRGHGLSEFERAFHDLRSRGIKIGVHLLFGLPGEGLADVLDAADYLSTLRPDGVKIHNLRIVEGSPLFVLANRGEIPLLGRQRYAEWVASFLARIPPEVVVLRLGFDPPRGRLVLPSTFIHKSLLYRAVDDELAARGLRQGSLLC